MRHSFTDCSKNSEMRLSTSVVCHPLGILNRSVNGDSLEAEHDTQLYAVWFEMGPP
jgi:hypothetical protein